MTEMKRPVRIANCSGFFGDRLAAAEEMVDGGPIDVLTGDWLAELTMLILARQRLKAGEGSGWARTFAKQMEQVLGTCLERGIKVVSNAGGLDPEGCAAAIRAKADEMGLGQVKIAYVTGDDLMPRIDELRGTGEPLLNLDTGEELDALGFNPLTANAYIGARGITEALNAGADVVITGRVTDAALAIGSNHRERAADVLAVHVDDLAVADRRDGDERHVETVHQRGARIADQPVAGRAGREDHREHAERDQQPLEVRAVDEDGEDRAHGRRS